MAEMFKPNEIRLVSNIGISNFELVSDFLCCHVILVLANLVLDVYGNR
jgi:hypothetical protein